jgi:hypothetical protein
MWPAFSRLSESRKQAVDLIYAKIGFLGIACDPHLRAAIERNNIERVCSIVCDEQIAELYRRDTF